MREPIVVTGMGVVSPLGCSVEGMWRRLVASESGLRRLPDDVVPDIVVAGFLTEAIGLSSTLNPVAWLGLFGDDPAMLATGSLYLRIVGPFYGFLGFGLALYFAAQGAGRVGWPLAGSLLRMTAALGGAWVALSFGSGISGPFLALALGFVVMGVVNGTAFATGALFPSVARVASPATGLAPAAGLKP